MMADASPPSSSLRTGRDEYTRRAILVEALRLLTERGPEGVSLRPLAEAVGYSPAALYRYFPNKEALLDALRAEGWAMLAAFEPSPADPALAQPAAVAERLAAYVQRILRFAAAQPHIYRLMVVDAGAPPLPAEAWRADPATADLLAALEQAAGAGDDPDGRSPAEMVMAAWLLAHGTAVLRGTLLAGEGELVALAQAVTAAPRGL